MKGTMTRVATWIAGLVLAAIPLTPALAVAHGFFPHRLPWSWVLIPWLGAFHLLLCWFSGQMIARILHELLGAAQD